MNEIFKETAEAFGKNVGSGVTGAAGYAKKVFDQNAEMLNDIARLFKLAPWAAKQSLWLLCRCWWPERVSAKIILKRQSLRARFWSWYKSTNKATKPPLLIVMEKLSYTVSGWIT